MVGSLIIIGSSKISLVPKSALLSYTDVLTSYAFEFCNISEIAGFYIPDTYLNNFYPPPSLFFEVG